MSDPAEGSPASDELDPRVWRVAAVALIAPFMTQLDSTVVNLSLSMIREDFHSSIATAQWIVSGYLLALALVLPLNGSLVERFGAKRLYLSCFSAFTLASVLCGAAQTMNELILARLLQGMAGGILAPMAQMMIARYAGKHIARVMGYSVVPVLIAPILGPVMAGAILKYASWPWLFFLNLPIGLLAVVLAMFLLPRDEIGTQRRPFDLIGFLLVSPGLACFLFGLQHAAEHGGVSSLLAGSILIATFVWYALRKGSSALIDLRLFANHVFSTAAITQLFGNGMFYARQFIVPLYLMVGCGVSAPRAGWLVAATGFGMMCLFPWMGFLTERFGCRAVASAGALLALLGTLPFLWMVQYHFSTAITLGGLFVAGAGQGMISIPSVSAAYASVPKERLAMANTAINIVQRVGAPLATTVIAVFMFTSSTAPSASGPRQFMFAFILLITLHLFTLGATVRLPVLMREKGVVDR